jgi:hypothetical protein
MKQKRFAEEQIAFALRQTESGTTISEICRKMAMRLFSIINRYRLLDAGISL